MKSVLLLIVFHDRFRVRQHSAEVPGSKGGDILGAAGLAPTRTGHARIFKPYGADQFIAEAFTGVALKVPVPGQTQKSSHGP